MLSTMALGKLQGSYPPLGLRVRGALVMAGLRQMDAAAEMGISQGELSRRITGRRPWHDGDITKIAKLCGVTVRSLTGPRQPSSEVAA